MTTTITFSPGEHIQRAAQMLVDAAPATGTFNDITLTADGNVTAEAIVDDYMAESERRSRAYLESPEGRKAARRRQIEIENLQAKADRLMETLPTIFDGPSVTAILDRILGWLSEMGGPRDHVGVKVDVPHIVSAFTSHGYKLDANCGTEFNEHDPDNFARWIIGQALQEPYYPGTQRFVDEWRERFIGKVTA